MTLTQPCERCAGYARCYCGPAYDEREAICAIIAKEHAQHKAWDPESPETKLLADLERRIRARNATFDHRDAKERGVLQ